ncbi:hypothetical protein ACFQU7_25445 [Pseudoroseomonas wenyumeiae]
MVEATYQDEAPDRSFLTANEIHIPVGRPVRIELAAADVIHSFWAPNLAGKQDMIPGRDNAITFTAQQPGIWRGQCAEFCGLQHAHMALLVVAEPPEAFERWREAQIAEARPRPMRWRRKASGCWRPRPAPPAIPYAARRRLAHWGRT